MKTTESDIENLALEELEALGWAYVYGPDLASDGKTPERHGYGDVLLMGRLKDAIRKFNPSIPSEAQEQAVKQICRISSPDLVANNESFHKALTDGVEVEYRKDGHVRGAKVWLVDFENIDNNDFLAVNQFTIIENGQQKRPDVVLFVNGIPLVVIELKNPSDENATVRKAYDQLQTYKAVIPSLFTFNAILVASDGLDAKAGSISAGFSRFMAWKTEDGKKEASKLSSQLETMVRGMLNRKTLLDLARHFIVFEKHKHIDPATGVSTVATSKILAAYHQYYAVNKAVESTLKASVEGGSGKGGVVWHTQGSGKSLSMVFYAGKLVLSMGNPTLLVITDRNDLDEQLFDTFASSTQILRQEPVHAESREHLKLLLKGKASGGIVFSTIQMFLPEKGQSGYETLSERRNIVVIADEAHRTQYGFDAKIVDEKDDDGKVVGQRIAYGFAKYMRDALPNATYIGFTGTPIESTDANTPAVFGNYIDIYDISQSIADGATVKIFYESRLAKVGLSDEGRKLLEEFDKELEQDELSERQKAKAKWTKLEAIVGNANRVANVAKDIVTHFEAREKVLEGKGMIVAMSRRIAVALYKEIVKLRPEWAGKALDEGQLKVVITSSSSDSVDDIPVELRTNKEERQKLADRFKDPSDKLKLVIVRDMWLTGFDAPCLHTLYVDKPMRGHNLMQAIARVNRIYKDKAGGLVVDYLGIATDLKNALSFYADSGRGGNPTETQAQAVEAMLEKLEVVRQMFHGFDYKRYFAAKTSTRLSIILQAEEHVLGLEKGKERYLKEVSLLGKLFAIAVPDEKAMAAVDEVAFFQAVKARLVKLEPHEVTGGRSDYEMETAIRQLVDQALVSDKVIDIFDAAGIKKPEISVLSDDFLREVQGMKHKNLAIELLRKLLNNEIKMRAQRNLVFGGTLAERLENAIRKYQNNLLSTAEIIQELIKLAKDIRASDKRGETLNLSSDELAFYDALEVNDSAVKVLGDDKLRDIARELTIKVRASASIDWTIKESVRAKLVVLVKRTLAKYGYPPDKQKKAIETVMKQAEMLADVWTTK